MKSKKVIIDCATGKELLEDLNSEDLLLREADKVEGQEREKVRRAKMEYNDKLSIEMQRLVEGKGGEY